MRALLALAALCAVAQSLAPPTHHALDAEPIVPSQLHDVVMPEAVKTVRAIALHVPKTGGSTVTEYFANCSTVVVQPDNATAHDMTAAMAARTVTGPRRRDGVLDVLVGMRHPVDRAISAVLWRAGYGERTHDPEHRARMAPALPDLEKLFFCKAPGCMDGLDGVLEHYTAGMECRERDASGAMVVPICNLDADLPVLAKTYGCEEKAVGHFHQSQDSINATRRAERRAALEEAFPKDMPLWRKCCEHQGYEPGDVREVRVP